MLFIRLKEKEIYNITQEEIILITGSSLADLKLTEADNHVWYWSLFYPNLSFFLIGL